jgi:hypothetical protein
MNLLYLVSELEAIERDLTAKVNILAYYGDISVDNLLVAKSSIRKQIESTRNSEALANERQDYYGEAPDTEEMSMVVDMKRLIDKRIGERTKGITERIEGVNKDVLDRIEELKNKGQ